MGPFHSAKATMSELWNADVCMQGPQHQVMTTRCLDTPKRWEWVLLQWPMLLMQLHRSLHQLASVVETTCSSFGSGSVT